MSGENNKQQGNETSSVIEDLTLKETESTNVKGGARFVGNSFGFGIEREMKES